MSDIRNNLEFGSNPKEHFFTLDSAILSGDAIKKEDTENHVTKYHFVKKWDEDPSWKVFFRRVKRIFLAIITFGIMHLINHIQSKGQIKAKAVDSTEYGNIVGLAKLILMIGKNELILDDHTLKVNVEKNKIAGVTIESNNESDVDTDEAFNALNSYKEELIEQKKEEIIEYLREECGESFDRLVKMDSIEMNINPDGNVISFGLTMGSKLFSKFVYVDLINDDVIEKLQEELAKKLIEHSKYHEKVARLIELENYGISFSRVTIWKGRNFTLSKSNHYDGVKYSFGEILPRNSVYVREQAQIYVDGRGGIVSSYTTEFGLESLLDAFLQSWEAEYFAQKAPEFMNFLLVEDDHFTFDYDEEEITCSITRSAEEDTKVEFVSSDGSRVSFHENEILTGDPQLANVYMPQAIKHLSEEREKREQMEETVALFLAHELVLSDGEKVAELSLEYEGNPVTIARNDDNDSEEPSYTISYSDKNIEISKNGLLPENDEEAEVIKAITAKCNKSVKDTIRLYLSAECNEQYYATMHSFYFAHEKEEGSEFGEKMLVCKCQLHDGSIIPVPANSQIFNEECISSLMSDVEKVLLLEDEINQNCNRLSGDVYKLFGGLRVGTPVTIKDGEVEYLYYKFPSDNMGEKFKLTIKRGEETTHVGTIFRSYSSSFGLVYQSRTKKNPEFYEAITLLFKEKDRLLFHATSRAKIRVLNFDFREFTEKPTSFSYEGREYVYTPVLSHNEQGHCSIESFTIESESVLVKVQSYDVTEGTYSEANAFLEVLFQHFKNHAELTQLMRKEMSLLDKVNVEEGSSRDYPYLHIKNSSFDVHAGTALYVRNVTHTVAEDIDIFTYIDESGAQKEFSIKIHNLIPRYPRTKTLTLLDGNLEHAVKILTAINEHYAEEEKAKELLPELLREIAEDLGNRETFTTSVMLADEYFKQVDKVDFSIQVNERNETSYELKVNEDTTYTFTNNSPPVGHIKEACTAIEAVVEQIDRVKMFNKRNGRAAFLSACSELKEKLEKEDNPCIRGRNYSLECRKEEDITVFRVDYKNEDQILVCGQFTLSEDQQRIVTNDMYFAGEMIGPENFNKIAVKPFCLILQNREMASSLDEDTIAYLFSSNRKKSLLKYIDFDRVPLDLHMSLSKVQSGKVQITLQELDADSHEADRIRACTISQNDDGDVLIVDESGDEIEQEIKRHILHSIKSERVRCDITQSTQINNNDEPIQYIDTTNIKEAVSIYRDTILRSLELKETKITGNTGEDHGGPSREFFSTLLLDLYQLLPKSTDFKDMLFELPSFCDFEKPSVTFTKNTEKLVQLGKICAMAYGQKSSVPTGKIFSPLFFEIMKKIEKVTLRKGHEAENLEAKHFVADLKGNYVVEVIEFLQGKLTFSDIMKNRDFLLVVLLAIEEEELKGFSKKQLKSLDIVSEALEEDALDETHTETLQMLEEVLLVQENYQHFINYVHYIVDTEVGSYVTPAVAVLKGMLQSVNSPLKYKINLEAVKQNTFAEELQGKFSKENVIENLHSSSKNPIVKLKISWIKELIRSWNENMVMNFLQFVTGCRALAPFDSIKIAAVGANDPKKDDAPIAHTCSNQLDIRNNWISEERLKELEEEGLVPLEKEEMTSDEKVARITAIQEVYKKEYQELFEKTVAFCSDGYSFL